MEVSVWDTYVDRNDGKQMHFDIIVPSSITDIATVLNYGHAFLSTKPFQTKNLTSSECRYCHIEQATEAMTSAIAAQGFYILEMENCD